MLSHDNIQEVNVNNIVFNLSKISDYLIIIGFIFVWNNSGYYRKIYIIVLIFSVNSNHQIVKINNET